MCIRVCPQSWVLSTPGNCIIQHAILICVTITLCSYHLRWSFLCYWSNHSLLGISHGRRHHSNTFWTGFDSSSHSFQHRRLVCFLIITVTQNHTQCYLFVFSGAELFCTTASPDLILRTYECTSTNGPIVSATCSFDEEPALPCEWSLEYG